MTCSAALWAWPSSLTELFPGPPYVPGPAQGTVTVWNCSENYKTPSEQGVTGTKAPKELAGSTQHHHGNKKPAGQGGGRGSRRHTQTCPGGGEGLAGHPGFLPATAGRTRTPRLGELSERAGLSGGASVAEPSVQSTATPGQRAAPPHQRGLPESREMISWKNITCWQNTENLGSAGREVLLRSEHLLLLRFDQVRRSCNVPLNSGLLDN